MMMKKFTAMLLALLMVSFCFAVSVAAEETTEEITAESAESVDSVDTTEDATSEDATSEDATSEDATSEDATSEDATSEDAPAEPEIIKTNVAKGVKYTVATDDGQITYQGSCSDIGAAIELYTYLLTDGVVREAIDEEDDGTFNRGDAVAGITVELAGTNRIWTYTFDIKDCNVSSVVIRNVRRASNRYTNIESIEVLSGGKWVEVDFTEDAQPVANTEQYSPDQGATVAPQFYDLVASFDEIAATQVKITLSTDYPDGADANGVITPTDSGRAYIAQLDEIEIYSVETVGGEEPSTSEAPTTSSSAPSTSTPSTDPNGDAGIAVFAVLAVVSLAGVVVAKKVK